VTNPTLIDVPDGLETGHPPRRKVLRNSTSAMEIMCFLFLCRAVDLVIVEKKKSWYSLAMKTLERKEMMILD
jgi:hypothetical protein